MSPSGSSTRVTSPSSSSPSTGSLCNDLKPFLFGGMAACAAEAVTFPIDTAKTRLQLQGQKLEEAKAPAIGQVSKVFHPYTGMIDCWRRISVEEGFLVLYRGLSPALLRQASYGTIKFGLYYTLKGWIPGEESSMKNIGCAVIAGSVSAAVASPTDLLKVRQQAKNTIHAANTPESHVPRGLFRCFREIYLHEGARGLFRGVVPTAQRAGVVAGVQLPVYDFAKLFFLRHHLMVDGAGNHLVSSFCAGLCACLASSPMDVVRTRMMNQRKLKSTSRSSLTTGGRTYSDPSIYRSSIHCAVLTVRSEGISALYKGFVPSFTRMGPWNIIFFLVYEELKQAFTVPSTTAKKGQERPNQRK